MRNFAIILLALLSLSFQSASGTRFVNFENDAAQVDTVYNDDIFTTGFKIKFDSQVYGDLFSFSYEMVQSDSIDGSFMAFAHEVQNLGPITGSFRAFGRLLSCNNYVGRNLLMGGQTINVGPGAKIMRDTDLWGASVVFQGNTNGDLHINSGAAVISGYIGGDIFFKGDSLTINPNTIIIGDLNYDSPSRAVIGDGVSISGTTNWKRTEVKKGEELKKEEKGLGFWSALTWIASPRGYLVWSILSSLLVLIGILIPFPAIIATIAFWFIMLICGNITILLTKSKAYASESVIKHRFFPSMGLGFVIFMLVPVISVVFFFTLLLVPLAMMLTMLFGVAVFVGGVYISLFVGRNICKIFGRNAWNTPGYLCYTIGMTALIIVSLIPILGYLVIFAALLTGVGGLAQALWKPRQEPPAAPSANIARP